MGDIRIYLEAMGYFWSISPKNFLIMAGRFIKTGKYPDYSRYGTLLKKPPYPHVYKRRDMTRWGASTHGTYLYHVTDWDVEEYISAFKEIFKEFQNQKKGKR